MPTTDTAVRPQRWQGFVAACLRYFHAYANWLVGISWRRFAVLAVLLLIAAAFLREVPPFSWSYTHKLPRAQAQAVAKPATPPNMAPNTPPNTPPNTAPNTAPTTPPTTPPSTPAVPAPPATDASAAGKIELKVDRHGVRIGVETAPAASAASAAASAARAAPAAGPSIDIQINADSDSPTVREAIADARRSIEEALREARDVKREADQAAHDTAHEHAASKRELGESFSVREVSLGRFLPNLALFWIVASAIVKITYKRQIQAEAQAAQAVQVAEAESLKRQVIEARMAAMQAQVEPHFLFNTLASIDHLIEVDPPRASQMQKHLIALLRSAMPNLRDAGSAQHRDLAAELAMIRPYLEILKMRMEERLSTAIDVPDGLLSAEFPPMMLQTLVENAIRHGLEPKPEGGAITIRAEIVHGKLNVSVTDTGLGFGRAATAGTGVGLGNIRERLQLRHAGNASLVIAANPGGGTVATIALPYRSVGVTAAAAAAASSSSSSS